MAINATAVAGFSPRFCIRKMHLRQRTAFDVRKMAKSTDIAMTTSAVPNASQSASKRLMVVS
jgi:hypothetical protein